MIAGAGVKPFLASVGHYVSGPGGAERLAVIAPNHLLFELITGGAVYAPDGMQMTPHQYLILQRMRPADPGSAAVHDDLIFHIDI